MIKLAACRSRLMCGSPLGDLSKLITLLENMEEMREVAYSGHVTDAA